MPGGYGVKILLPQNQPKIRIWDLQTPYVNDMYLFFFGHLGPPPKFGQRKLWQPDRQHGKLDFAHWGPSIQYVSRIFGIFDPSPLVRKFTQPPLLSSSTELNVLHGQQVLLDNYEACILSRMSDISHKEGQIMHQVKIWKIPTTSAEHYRGTTDC